MSEKQTFLLIQLEPVVSILFCAKVNPPSSFFVLSVLCQVLKWFRRTNTIGGLSTTLNADNKKSGVFWFILFSTGLVLTSFNVWQTFNEYFEHKSLTKISTEYPSHLGMPAVSICNSNRVHCYNLYDTINEIPKVVNKVRPCQRY